jgi:hypothetical protein
MFINMIESVTNDINKLDLLLSKINIFNESSFDEYSLDLKRNLLKVITEGGDNEKLDKANSVSSSKLNDRSKKSVGKVTDSTKKFVSSVYGKVRDFLNAPNVKALASKLENDSSDQSFNIKCNKARLEALGKVDDKVLLNISKFKATGKLEKGVVKEIEKSYNEAKKTKLDKTNIKLKDAVSIFKDLDKEFSADDEKAYNEQLSSCLEYEVSDAESINAYVKLIAIHCRIIKDTVSAKKDTLYAIVAGMKQLSLGKKEEVATEESVVENEISYSRADINEILNNIYKSI